MVAVVNARKNRLFSTTQVCNYLNLQRDAYYKCKRRYAHRKAVDQKVVDLVKNERNLQARVGTRKLHKALNDTLLREGLKIGRDRLFNILRDNDMLIRRKKVSYRTTNSHHHFHKHNNIIKDIKVTAPNQVWVSDITYIRTVKGFCYLALITDMYSRKIVGYDLSDSLELAGCLRALKKALASARPAAGLIHHSDRGIQYCSKSYVSELQKRKISISMTQENHCYENAIAERINGILKDEFFLDQCFLNTHMAKVATRSAIEIYNSKRLHLSLGYKTPNMVFNNYSLIKV